jgi:predicted metalloprotease with PDZ domain
MLGGLLALVLAAPPAELTAEYVVRAGPGARVLEIEARFAGPAGTVLEVDERCGPFVETSADRRGDAVFVEGCTSGPCTVRYRFDLGEAARVLSSRRLAFEHEGALLAPPSTFLLRPPRAPGGRFTLRVETTPPVVFATGLRPVEGGWSATWADLPESPWSGFGPFSRERIDVPGGVVDLFVAPGRDAPPAAALRAWVQRAARAAETVYGALPVSPLAVIALPGTRRRGVGFGTTLGNGGASIMVWLGAGTTPDELLADWVLAHEMMHLGVPNLDRRHRWLEEGLATYLEEVGRARAGFITREEARRSFLVGMPKGQPQVGDRGLDHTHTWGRTYWGGALFAMMADLDIRERTGMDKGLDDALRQVVAAGGTIATRWPIARLLETADAGTGTTVLQDLYRAWGSEPVTVDLDAAWRRLDRGPWRRILEEKKAAGPGGPAAR